MNLSEKIASSNSEQAQPVAAIAVAEKKIR
jgi:hypothetical protein